MGTFIFKWPHAAEEVYVTGTFDGWSKSQKLGKVGDVFEKKVTLPETSEPIFYKFVVDNSWTTDHEAPQATDSEGNENNVLHPEDIVKENAKETAPATAAMDTADSEPVEGKKEDTTSSSLPGTYPQTPGTEVPAKEKEFSVNPLPATEGAVNPVQNGTGHKIHEALDLDINKHVALDKDSYEQSDRLPGGVPSAVVPSDFTPLVINSAAPESSSAQLAALVPQEPKDVPTLNSAAANSTTARLAAQVPLESKEAPSASEGTTAKETEKSATDEGLIGAVTAAEAVVAAAAGTLYEKTQAAVEKVVDNAIPAASDAATTVTAAVSETVAKVMPTASEPEEISPRVPDQVKESIEEAHKAPEATANTAAVEAKEAVEQELLQKVDADKAAGETEEVSSKVPAQVKESIEVADKASEAAVDTAAIEAREAVEQDQLKEVEPAKPEPEPSTAASKTETETPKTEGPVPPAVSDDVEMAALEVPEALARPATGTPVGESAANGSKAPAAEPVATNGAEASTTKAPETPTKAPVASPAASPATKEKKKNPIRKILDRFKERVHKDKASN